MEIKDFYIDKKIEKIKKKMSGVEFTPVDIAERMAMEIVEKIDRIDSDFCFLDIASGTGIFTYILSLKIFEKFGIPVKEVIENHSLMVELNELFVKESVKIFQKESIKPNIVLGDALMNFEDDKKFDVVIGNPPYVRIQNMDKQYANVLRRSFKCMQNGNVDLYYAFIEKSINVLKIDGISCLITPSSYLINESAKVLRNIIYKDISKIIKMDDKVFDVNTYTIITLFERGNTDNFFNHISKEKTIMVEKKNLLNKKLLLNNKGSKKLGDACSMKGGIATLRDKIFQVKSPILKENILYKGNDKIDLDSVVPLLKISKIKNKSDLEKNDLFVIFPYNGSLTRWNKLSENELKLIYPNTYIYLLKNKNELLKRDKGKSKGYKWFEFGRGQGLCNYTGDVIISSAMNAYPNFIKCDINGSLVSSGIVLYDFKEDMNNLLEILNSKSMFEYMKDNGRKFGGDWRGYSIKILREFKY